MSKIALNNLGITFPETLFQNLNLSVDPGDRIGIVGNNGSGKSSLIRCIQGELEATDGDITLAHGLHLGIVEQEVPDALMASSLRDVIVDAIPEDERVYMDWKADVLLDALKTPEEYRAREIKSLSGGWQRLALIARTWLKDPDVLILDEPTNHLDLSKILLLEKWLIEDAGDMAMIIVSHDREFLQACTTATLFMRPGESVFFRHSYARAKALLDEQDQANLERREKDQKQLKRMQKSAHEMRQMGVNHFSDHKLHKAVLMERRAAKMEAEIADVHVETKRDIKINNRDGHAKVVVWLEDVLVKAPDGTELFAIEKMDIKKHDRIVLLGRNGTGKTQFVTAIRRALDLAAHETGEGIRVSPSVVTGYMDQELSHLPLDISMKRYLSDRFSLADLEMTRMLTAAGFRRDNQDKLIGQFSPGQRSRFALLVLRLEKPSFFLLDEPTNHVDIAGQEQLEAEIIDKQATCLVVSHDRKFIANIATRYWLIENRRLVELDQPDMFYETLIAA